MLLGVLVAQCLSESIPVPPKKLDCLGVWNGFDGDAIMFYRLVLTDTNAVLCYSVPQHPPKVFKVGSWEIDDKGLIALTLVKGEQAEHRVSLKGVARINRLEVRIADADGSWSRSVNLFREDKVKARIDELTDAMR